MFKKKPQIKPLAPLRSSDRRKTADSIIADLKLSVPVQPPANEGDASAADAEDKGASTAALTALRNALLPENAQAARFTTTAGPDLKQVSGTIYVGSYEDSEAARILWFRVGERMHPTVYALWRNPAIVPLIHTPDVVVQKLRGGADLMTPGLARGPPFPARAKKGAIVAVAPLESPSVPLAVGTCLIDICDLQEVRGAKGHAVQTAHWMGDELWAWSPNGKPGAEPPAEIDGWDQDEELAKQTEGLQIDDNEDGGVALNAGAGGSASGVEPGPGAPVDGEDTGLFEQVPPEPVNLTTKDIDAAFRNAFLYGVTHYKNTGGDAPNFGLQFPLSQSFVMSNLVQPFLPTFTPQHAQQLQMKKTSWKNIKKFIKSLDKEKIIKAKDRDGNEVVILDIDFDDQAILDFVPYKLPKKETATGTSLGRGEKATAQAGSADPAVGQKLKKLELYRPRDKLAPLFTAAKADTKAFYTAAELRPIVTTYIEAEDLISATNKRLVRVDPVLANAVFDGSAGAMDKEVVAKGSVPRDTLIDRVIKACASYYVILRNGETFDAATAKPRAGAAPKVHVVLETRSGNKTVTKVSGVEAYFVSPQPLADELRKACAGSTSVERLVGSSPKNPVMEVMVQGPQKDAVIKALEKRGVNKAWVEVVDKTKGKKKG
ncbi:eukaryotic translation initiation factor SUI1 family protein [Lineolata rhizophorae]|uniref:Eukaryotic translation initiation factor SUI1 family protein n=1 Tax=Lineolata rhizophorae TaxID=578093 RepID=A0A6A6PEH6_9PEZI|nr:eukaryotic translation initiation factor SUI1 family protein [Lineolata rhizophorae]